MSNIYRKEIEFSYSDIDLYDNVFPKAIFQAFQDVAGEHADILKCGYEDFKKKDLIWILVRNYYKLLSPLKAYHSYIIETFPVKPELLNFQRDYKIIDKENDETVCVGTSIWVVTNIITRKLVRISTIGGTLSDENFDYSNDINKQPILRSLPKDVQKIECSLTQKVIFPFLDHNRHMNNTYYSSLVCSVLPLDESNFIEQIQINFEKECMKDDILTLFMEKRVDNFYYIVGYKNDDIVSFTSKVSLKNRSDK